MKIYMFLILILYRTFIEPLLKHILILDFRG